METKENNWKEKYDKEHKLRQEAEGELTIVKTITIDSSPEMRAAKEEIEVLKATLRGQDYFKGHDYKFLVEENKRLVKTINEVLNDNKKLAAQVEDKINQLRKSGVI